MQSRKPFTLQPAAQAPSTSTTHSASHSTTRLKTVKAPRARSFRLAVYRPSPRKLRDLSRKRVGPRQFICYSALVFPTAAANRKTFERHDRATILPEKSTAGQGGWHQGTSVALRCSVEGDLSAARVPAIRHPKRVIARSQGPTHWVGRSARKGGRKRQDREHSVSVSRTSHGIKSSIGKNPLQVRYPPKPDAFCRKGAGSFRGGSLSRTPAT